MGLKDRFVVGWCKNVFVECSLFFLEVLRREGVGEGSY